MAQAAAVPLDDIPDQYRPVPEDDLPEAYRAVPEDDLPPEFSAEAEPPAPISLGPPIAGPGRRVSKPSPRTVPEAAPQYPLGVGMPDVAGAPGRAFMQDLAQQLEPPSGSDVGESVSTSLARVVQGTRLQQLENEKSKLLYRGVSDGDF